MPRIGQHFQGSILSDGQWPPVTMDAGDIESAAEELDSLGLEVDTSELLRSEYNRPFDCFASDRVDEPDTE